MDEHGDGHLDVFFVFFPLPDAVACGDKGDHFSPLFNDLINMKSNIYNYMIYICICGCMGQKLADWHL